MYIYFNNMHCNSNDKIKGFKNPEQYETKHCALTGWTHLLIQNDATFGNSLPFEYATIKH